MAAMKTTVHVGSGLAQTLPARVAAFRPATRARQAIVTKASLKDSKVAQSVASLGAAASLLVGGVAHADDSIVVAAQQVNEAAEQVVRASGYNRGLLLAGMMVPAIGWVLYNILDPGMSQLKNMRVRSTAAGLGLTAASLLIAQQAEAANEVSELAAGDNRLLILTVIFVPALGWVAFNILGPALNQLANMSSQNKRR